MSAVDAPARARDAALARRPSSATEVCATAAEATGPRSDRLHRLSPSMRRVLAVLGAVLMVAVALLARSLLDGDGDDDDGDGSNGGAKR